MWIQYWNVVFFSHFLIGFYFAFYGVWNIYHWSPIMAAMIRDRIPHPYLLLPLAILWQFILGTMIMFNMFPHFAALALIPCTFLYVIIFHPFWNYRGELRILNFSIFMTNITVTMGALLLVIGSFNHLTDAFAN